MPANGPGDAGDTDHHGTGVTQRPSGFGSGGAGRHDVVDDHHPTSAHERRAPHGQCAGKIGMARVDVEPRLIRDRSTLPQNGAHLDAQPGSPQVAGGRDSHRANRIMTSSASSGDRGRDRDEHKGTVAPRSAEHADGEAAAQLAAQA